jgi:hypothetical protein
LTGRKEQAAAAIPLSLVEEVALVGPLDKIAKDLQRWRDTVVTTLQVSGPISLLRTVAEVVRQ